MNSERTLIASVVFLCVGLALIFGYCHGTVGFNAVYPASGTSLQISINTTGIPAIVGAAATVVGTLLLIAASVQALFGHVSGVSENPRPHSA